MKQFTIEQLKEHEGKKGQSVLVAVNGKVYDLSSSRKWVAGLHMNRHHAWTDLSDDIKAAPHGLEVLERFSVVGTIAGTEQQDFTGFRALIDSWLRRYPFFRRHPHPAIVHFPLGLLMAAPLFEIMAHIFDSSCTTWASFCCLALGMISVPVAMVSGYFTWWINYGSGVSPLIARKRNLAWITLVLGIIVIVLRLWFYLDPSGSPYVLTPVYYFGLVILALLIAYIGYLGGKLTFPY